MLNYDVVIIGGGPSGALAAIASGRNGAKTLLVEQYGFLGGMLTAAGTGPQMTYHAGNVQVIDGIPGELIRRMESEGFSPGHMEDFAGYTYSVTPFDAEGLKWVLEKMALEAGVDILYHTVYTGCRTGAGNITSVKLFSKNGFFEASAKTFVDASSDADLAFHAGVSTVYGREQDGLSQPMTLNMKVYGVDRQRVIKYVRDNRDDMLPTIPFDRLEIIPRTGIQGSFNLVKRLRDEGKLTVDRERVLVFETGNPGEFIVNMSRIYKKSAIDPFDLSAAETEGRRQCHEIFGLLKKYIPGFENSFMHSTGPAIGIRESRRINGVYKITSEDLLSNTMFDDAVVMGGYPIDVHPPDGVKVKRREYKHGSWYSIPFRAMIANEINNIVVTGRCISVSHEALGSIRVTPIVMALGQAAGTAAALAAKEGCPVNKIDTRVLRAALLKDGAFLEPYRAG